MNLKIDLGLLMYRGRASKWYLACRRSFTGNRCEEESLKSVSMEFSGESEMIQATGKQEEGSPVTSGCCAVDWKFFGVADGEDRPRQ